jgi:hypothetical protein
MQNQKVFGGCHQGNPPAEKHYTERDKKQQSAFMNLTCEPLNDR